MDYGLLTARVATACALALAVSALSAQTSPFKQMLESIRDETAVTRERPKPKDAPAPAIMTTEAAAPTQISVFRDGMLTHSRPQHIAQRDQLRQIPVAKPSFAFAEFV